MTNTQTLKEVINHIQLSAMEPREKAMWMLLLPNMEEQAVAKLKLCLAKETDAITDLYLNVFGK